MAAAMSRLLVLLLCLATLQGPLAAAQPLPAEMSAALAAAGIPQDAVAVFVREPGAQRPMLAHSAERPMRPASTMKLLTAAAALDLLGPAYSWRTEARLAGRLEQGVLEGDLVLRGGGDPALTLDRFWMLLRELRARGLREIRGDLVADRSHFGIGLQDPGAFDGAADRPYNAGPDALLVNFKSLRLRFLPQAVGAPVTILAEPPLPAVRVISELVGTAGDCDSWPEDPVPDPGPGILRFRGGYPVACAERNRAYSPLDPDRYLEGLFRQLWEELGGRWSGHLRSGSAPEVAAFAVAQSPPLADVLRDMNKFSNNVMARNLYLTLGVAAGVPPLTPALARSAVSDWLRRAGLDFPELVVENGSGLSRSERISARHLVELLEHMHAGPWQAEFAASLPVAGVDGTLRRRLAEGPAAGRAHLKTGYLEGVRAMAGYVLDARGHTLAVAVLVNHPAAAGSAAAQDALVRWLAGTPQRGCCGSRGPP